MTYVRPVPTDEQMAAAAAALGHPWPLPGDEHPDLTRLREREITALAYGYGEGDVNHNVQPVVGWMRLLANKGDLPDADDLTGWIPRLIAACDAEYAFLAEQKAARLAAEKAAEETPDIVMIYAPYSGGHQVFSSARRPLDKMVANHLIRTFRDRHRTGLASAATPPTGTLYTAAGATNLDDAFAKMWASPEMLALRTVPNDGTENHDPHLAVLEAAETALVDYWAGALAGDLA